MKKKYNEKLRLSLIVINCSGFAILVVIVDLRFVLRATVAVQASNDHSGTEVDEDNSKNKFQKLINSNKNHKKRQTYF